MAICVHRALCSVSLCCDCCRLSQITGLWGVSISQFANINATSLGLFEKCALHVSDLPFTLADLSLPLFTACISAFYLYFSSVIQRCFLRLAIQIVKVPKRQMLFGFQIHFLARAWPPYQYPFTWVQFWDKNTRRLFAVKLSGFRVAK